MRRYGYPVGFYCGCLEIWLYGRNTWTLEIESQCSIRNFAIIQIVEWLMRKENNYDNKNNGVPGAATGSKRAVPAISVDTIRGGRKEDPQ